MRWLCLHAAGRRGFRHDLVLASDHLHLTTYTDDLHHLHYTLKSGDRVMVQSTWFPLYDRNPQTFVPTIFAAPASAYRAQAHRVYRTSAQPSHVRVGAASLVRSGSSDREGIFRTVRSRPRP